MKKDPELVDKREKIKLVLDLNKTSFIEDTITSAITLYSFFKDKRIITSSEGDYIEVNNVMNGIEQLSIAKFANVMERVYDEKSKVLGWEFIESIEWHDFVTNVSKLAINAVKVKTPPPGTYTVVFGPEAVGLLLHEAFGHATEGDGVLSGESVLTNLLGKKVASELVTIVDDGSIEDGYYVPYDDEGVKKVKTVLVEKGILKTYLSSRKVAYELNVPLTGNSRAQDYKSDILIRQTNFYMEPGDYNFNELIEDIKFGLYVPGIGVTGGQVDIGMGTFTFNVGPSYIIRNGEIKELVRGVMISGNILETLKQVDAVGKDLKVTTSVVGGCVKNGQLVKVGSGGPHIRVKKIMVGGR